MNKSALITQSNYIPWKGYFDSINKVDELVLYDQVQYTRRDWRNRNRIKAQNGLKWLTVPVQVKGKYYQPINQTVVADAGWGKQHWKTLLHNYRKAPFFDKYADALESIYLDTRTNLSEINATFIRFICDALGIETVIRDSTDFELHEGKNERLISICEQSGVTDYYSGPAAKTYIDEDLFASHGIAVHWLDYDGYPEYDQLYGPFEHSVTILDLLFSVGDDAPSFMKSFA